MTEHRILVVDDDDAIRALLLTVLKRRGFRVDNACNGAEAVEKMGRCRYALILLDLMMPKLSGYEVLDQLGREPAGARPVAIVLTAGGDPHSLDSEIVAATLRKPFDIETLVETVAACIGAMPPPDPQRDDCPPADSENRRPNGTVRGVN